MYGFVPPRLAIARTAAMAFSSQSVMALAKADCAVPIRATANSPLQRLEYMLRSSGAGNPRVRIAAVTLSERVFGVNEPDGSHSGLAAIPTNVIGANFRAPLLGIMTGRDG